MACLAALWKVGWQTACGGLGAFLLGCCLAGLLPQTGLGQSDGEAVINREYPLKALFLYNFGSYVEWPPSSFASDAQPFVIGVLGSSPVESTLQEIAAARKIHGRQIVVEHYASAGAVKPCQMLFITRDVSPPDREAVVERLRHQQVLIVGESQGFAVRGAVVNFFIEANKIRFEINVDAAKQHQLKISSKLLALARIIEPSGVDGP